MPVSPGRPRICVDARMLCGGGTGVATYARALARAVLQIDCEPYQLSATGQSDGWLLKWAGAARPGSSKLIEVPSSEPGFGQMYGHDIFRRAQVHFNLYGKALALRCDLPPGVMHWTYPVPLVMEGWANIYTLHDVIPLTKPDMTPISGRRHRAILEALLRRVDRLVTVSDAARADIITSLGCDPALVVNCGQPVDIDGPIAPAREWGLSDGGYLLFCGSIEPRKNLAALLTAYRRSGVSMPLMVVGPDGWRSDGIKAELERTPGAVRLPYVSRQVLLGLIKGARCLLFPSLAEGFGLPVAEAMALGTPVLTSHNGALAEVAGGAAHLVDPEDIYAIAAAIRLLATNEALANRLRTLGLARAEAFSARSFEERLEEVYRAAIANYRFSL